jgi:hypothetical protein
MALGGSVLTPLTAMAESAHDQSSGADHAPGSSAAGFNDTDSDDTDSDHVDDSAPPARAVARHRRTPTVRRTPHTRPMSSGEEQYRNGCLQGYIAEGCSQYDVPHLLRRGINPFL